MKIALSTPAATLLLLLGTASQATELASAPLLPLTAPTITAPTSSSTVIGTEVLFEGTAQPGTVVTVTEAGGATVCSASVDAQGNWSCVGTQTLGRHQVTASAAQDTRISEPSGPVGYEVLRDELQTGGGCSTSGEGPIGIALLALAWSLRRRAGPPTPQSVRH